MSCFIHNDCTYDRLLATCANLNNQSQWYFRETPKEWLTKLRNMNIEAFKERYQGRHSENIPSEWIPHNGTPFTNVEAFKILQSIDYQCSDCSDWSNSGTRMQLEQLQLEFLSNYVSRTKEYEQAGWS